MNSIKENWDSGNSYEHFMGRWSKLLALEFLNWLDLPNNLRWLDIGCGTGALSETISRHFNPSHLTCIDPSEEFLNHAKKRLNNKGEFLIGDAIDIPQKDNSIDVVVSGLVLNFIPDLRSALAEMKRILKRNGLITAYVWDYSGRMDFLRYFWDAAFMIDPESANLDEGARFPICNSDNLKNAFQQADLSEIEVRTLDITTIFKDFNDYWTPFSGGQGPAPGYLASLSKDLRVKLRKKLEKNLPVETDGSIKLLGRAIVIKGKSS